MNGLPYIMYDDTYYKELNPTADFFTTDDDALLLLDSYLDTPRRNLQAKRSLKYVREKLIYADEMLRMSYLINRLLSKQKVMGDSEKLNEIIHYIRKRTSVTKQEMMGFVGWGRGIKWSPYRRALMKHPNIYDVNDSEPKYCWNE